MTANAGDAIQFEFSADPSPSQKLSKGNSQGKRPVGRPSKDSKQKELAEPIAMMIKIASAPIMFRDPVCGSVIMQQADELADALAAQAMDSPRLRKWLELMQSPGGWINVGMAAWPIILTVFQHHVANRGESESPIEGVHQGINPDLFAGFQFEGNEGVH